MTDDGDAVPPAALAARERERVVDRLRSLPQQRLGRAGPDGRSPAELAFDLAQWASDAAADLEGDPRRVLPRLSDLVVGDQVAVTTGDLLAAAGEGPEPALRHGEESCRELLDRLVALRRLL